MEVKQKALCVGVVIPTFNAGELLFRAIESVQASAKAADVKIKIVVVDCHPLSLDSSIKSESDYYITLRHNPGFGTAANTGFKTMYEDKRIERILLLNPDAYLQTDFFSILRDCLVNADETSPISPLILFDKNYFYSNLKEIISNKKFNQIFAQDPELNYLVTKNGEMVKGHLIETTQRDYHFVVTEETSSLYKLLEKNKWQTGHRVNNAGSFYIWPDIAGDIDFEKFRTPTKFSETVLRQSWCGAGVILSKSYLDRVGGFDERFFLYYEDTELALRGSKLGFLPLFHPELVVYHRHSASTGLDLKSRSRDIWKSRALFSAIASGKSLAFIIVLSRFLVAFARIVKNSRRFPGRSYIWFELYYGMRGVFLSLRKSRILRFRHEK